MAPPLCCDAASDWRRGSGGSARFPCTAAHGWNVSPPPVFPLRMPYFPRLSLSGVKREPAAPSQGFCFMSVKPGRNGATVRPCVRIGRARRSLLQCPTAANN